MESEAESRAWAWWDWRLFGQWVLVNAATYVVIPLVGVGLEQLVSTPLKSLVHGHRVLTVAIIAMVGGLVQGIVVGRWQWRLLRRRLPCLRRRRWVIASLLPAFIVWLLVIAPQAADLLARGGSTLPVFREGFVQALVLGPLIGLPQATALRGHTSRWAWWFAANVTTYLSGAGLHELGAWLREELSISVQWLPYFPVVAFAIHGTWMLWVTAPQAAARARPPTRPDDGQGPPRRGVTRYRRRRPPGTRPGPGSGRP